MKAWAILAALCLGAVLGLALHQGGSPRSIAILADQATLVAELFLRLIRMIVAPLVLAMLAAGIAGARAGGDQESGTGRIVLRAMGWFVAASLASLLLGLLLADWLRPGASLHLAIPAGTSKPAGFDAHAFLLHLVPVSVVDAMARNDTVQIVLFAVLFGAAIGSIAGPGASRLRTGLSDLADAMLRLTALVMRLAPVAVFCALFALFARQGPALAHGYALFVGGFYAAMLVLWALMLGAARLLIGQRIGALRGVAPSMLLAFATASSESVFPQLAATLEADGVPARVVGLVLPLGYAFNLDGSMLFQSFAALFIAQAYGIALSPWQQAGLLLVLMATSKGTAGVPRAAIVSLTAVLPAFGLPDAGLLLILGIDHLLDMGRSATSVLGNAVATLVAAGPREAMRRA